MRLIDADVLLARIRLNYCEHQNISACTMKDIVNTTPTAHNLETVIKQLEEFKAEAQQFNVLGLVTDMIEVVRKGGVDNE